MEEPPWKRLRLSLERPYKDDNGDAIPDLYDITPDGHHIYEPKETLRKKLGERLRRIFLERGADFFENGKLHPLEQINQTVQNTNVDNVLDHESQEETAHDKMGAKPMSTQDLHKMQMEILPQLFIALGEMSHARDLLSSLLTSKQPLQMELPTSQTAVAIPSPSHLSATVVNKPSSILSVQAFNAQLTIGGKDEALRKAAEVFKIAADKMEGARQRGEKYWLDALKIRRANWRLVPAPLPLSPSVGKGADKTSKDFFVVYGLEESSPFFRRQAVARMATYANDCDSLVFLHRQHTRLRISVRSADTSEVHCQSRNVRVLSSEANINGILQIAQQEIVEQEIFSLLVKEAANLPTALARVSERLIFIDAAPGMELQFELVDPDDFMPSSHSETNDAHAICDLIYYGLQILLLRRHNFLKTRRLGAAIMHEQPNITDISRVPPILQPVIDLLQYRVFCKRIRVEIDKMIQALANVDILSTLRFDPVGETGQDLLDSIDENSTKLVSGEAVIRIDNRCAMKLIDCGE
ncbi:hypothetical protein AX17_001093 [Amanita inopinata Kibby_2008]|nr:hypothetical protein AX17_001093 [Amanita inopinata Kibby_2008]